MSVNWFVGFIGILIFTIIVNVLTLWLNKRFSDQDRIKELNRSIKEKKASVKGLSDEESKLKVQNEILKLTTEKMRLLMKPMMFSMFVFIGVFPLMKALFNGFVLFVLPWSLPIIGNDVGWLLTYIILSIPVNQVVRKKMGVEV